MSKAKEETGLKRAILDGLTGSGLCEVWNQPSGSHRVKRGYLVCAPKGSSDVVGFLTDGTGRHLALEIKRPGEQPTPEQIASLARVSAAGGIAAIVHSPAEAIEVVRAAFRRAS
jgi:hypothetical protein